MPILELLLNISNYIFGHDVIYDTSKGGVLKRRKNDNLPCPENFGATAAITEMLMQSADKNYVILFYLHYLQQKNGAAEV